MENQCPFCNIIGRKCLLEISEYCIAFEDEYPVTPGHCLVVPKRHVESLFELTDEELKDLYSVIVDVKNIICNILSPDGFNIGINEGRAAGRTVDHAHIHIIPRYNGDMEDPRGGVRGVIPEKQKY